MVEAQSLADVFETAGDRERRGSHDDGIELFKQARAENLAHVNGSGREEHAFVAAFIPVDEIALVRLKEECQFLPDFEASTRNAQQLLRFLCQRGEFCLQPFERGG